MQYSLTFASLFLYIVLLVEVKILNANAVPTSTSNQKFGEISEQKCKEFGQHASTSSDNSLSLTKLYPHMAVFGYGNDTVKKWACGGALISSRHVLTAAHCLQGSSRIDIKFVRLGDLDTKSTTDIADPQDFTISKKIVHPDYNPRSHENDIGIAELDRDVRITEYVRPACLHLGSPLEESSELTATGWGKTQITEDASSTMLELKMKIIDNQECKKQYSVAKIDIDDEKQLCSTPSGESDTCQGFGGGPLQVSNSTGYEHSNLVGIISFGSRCGGKKIAGVNTKVSHYVPWIESIVWKS